MTVRATPSGSPATPMLIVGAIVVDAASDALNDVKSVELLKIALEAADAALPDFAAELTPPPPLTAGIFGTETDGTVTDGTDGAVADGALKVGFEIVGMLGNSGMAL